MTSPLYRFRGHVQPTAGVRASILDPTVDDAGTATLRLYDPIDDWGGEWGVSAKEFTAALDSLPAGVSEIRLHINSPGGLVTEALAILNSLRQHEARVVAIVDGIAASAASVIACASDELVMCRNTELMIHDARAIAIGPASTMREAAARLDKVSDNLAAIYADRTGAPQDEMRTAMLAETWYSAEEAVAAGLADRVEGVDPDPQAAQARFTLDAVAIYEGRRHAPAPAALAATPRSRSASVAGSTTPAAAASGDTQKGDAAVADITDEQLTTLRQSLGVAADADVSTCLAALEEALAERATEPTSAAAQDGTVVVDAEAYAALRRDAEAGAQARAQQQREHREQVVAAAVQDGRIPPARRDHWLALIEQDPGAESALADLAPGLVPVSELGHTGQTESAKAADDDQLYASIFSKEV